MHLTVPTQQKGPALSCLDYRHHHLVSHHRHRVVEASSQRLRGPRHAEREESHDVRHPDTVILSVAKDLAADRDRPFAEFTLSEAKGSG